MTRYLFIAQHSSLLGEKFVTDVVDALRQGFGVDNVAHTSMFDPLLPLLLPFVAAPKSLDARCQLDLSEDASDAENKLATKLIELAEDVVVGFNSELLINLLLDRLRTTLDGKRAVVVVSNVRLEKDLLVLKTAYPRSATLLLTAPPEASLACDSLAQSMFEHGPTLLARKASSFNLVSKGVAFGPKFLEELRALFLKL
jgi:hypothetical protein